MLPTSLCTALAATRHNTAAVTCIVCSVVCCNVRIQHYVLKTPKAWNNKFHKLLQTYKQTDRVYLKRAPTPALQQVGKKEGKARVAGICMFCMLYKFCLYYGLNIVFLPHE